LADSGELELQRGVGGGWRWSGEGWWHGEVGEYQQVKSDPFRASTWAEEEQKVGLDGEVEWRCYWRCGGGTWTRVSRGSVQPFYRRVGEGGAGRSTTEGGAAGTRPRQGCSVADASWLGRRESTATWRARVKHGWIRGSGERFGRGPVGALSFGTAHWQASLARWPAAPAPQWDTIGEGREERGREREKG
jgi:hypothetical protein